MELTALDVKQLKNLDLALQKARFPDMEGEEYLAMSAAWISLRNIVKKFQAPKPVEPPKVPEAAKEVKPEPKPEPKKEAAPKKKKRGRPRKEVLSDDEVGNIRVK